MLLTLNGYSVSLNWPKRLRRSPVRPDLGQRSSSSSGCADTA